MGEIHVDCDARAIALGVIRATYPWREVTAPSHSSCGRRLECTRSFKDAFTNSDKPCLVLKLIEDEKSRGYRSNDANLNYTVSVPVLLISRFAVMARRSCRPSILQLEAQVKLVKLSYECRLCGDVIVSNGSLVRCHCGAIGVDGRPGSTDSPRRMLGMKENFISRCVWKNDDGELIDESNTS